MIKKQGHTSIVIPRIIAITLFFVIQISVACIDRKNKRNIDPTLNNAITSFYDELDSYDTKKKVIVDALKVREETHENRMIRFPDDSIEKLHSYLGLLAFRQNKYHEAIGHYHVARGMNESSKKSEKDKIKKRANYYCYLGSLHNEFKQYDSALLYLNNELDIQNNLIQNNDRILTLYNNFGQTYINKEDYHNSIVYFLKIIQEIQLQNIKINEEQLFLLYTNIAANLYEIGYYEYAKNIYQKAHDINFYNLSNSAYIYQKLALVEEKLGNLDVSEVYYKKSKNIHTKHLINDDRNYIQLLFSYLSYNINNENYEKANKTKKEIESKLDGVPVVLQMEKLKYEYLSAEFFISQKKYLAAKKYLLKAIKTNQIDSLSGKPMSSSLYIETHSKLGKIFSFRYKETYNLQFLNTSIDYYKTGIDYISNSLYNLHNDDSKLNYNEKYYENRKEYLTLLFELWNRSDKKTTRDSIKKIIVYESDMCKYNILCTEMQNKNIIKTSKLVYYLIENNHNFFNNKNESLATLDLSLVDSIISINRRNHLKTRIVKDAHISICKNEFVINYILASDSLYCQCIYGEIDTILCLGKNINIESLINTSINHIKKCRPLDTTIASLRILSKIFKKPFSLIPASVKNVVMIPEGYVHKIPFDCLIQDTNSTTYLIEQYNIIDGLRLSLLKTNKAPITKYGNATISCFAPCTENLKLNNRHINALPFSHNEVLNIMENAKTDSITSKIYLDQEASKFKLIQALNSSEMIHLATHTITNNNSLNQNSFILNEMGTVELFHQWDICVNLVKANHIVLSTCNSGKGKLFNSEGVDSFIRTLYLAGIEHIIYTNWNIPDKFSSVFFADYYKNLFSGHTVNESLHLSKRQMLQDTKYNHPYYWACIRSL